MTQGCRHLCRLVWPECCFWWLQLSLTSLTPIDHCISFALQPHGATRPRLSRPRPKRQVVYSLAPPTQSGVGRKEGWGVPPPPPPPPPSYSTAPLPLVNDIEFNCLSRFHTMFSGKCIVVFPCIFNKIVVVVNLTFIILD